MTDVKKYHFILDPSALVSGIGNIKQWASNEECEFYIPYYTLKELDFLKKGGSLFAINARESVRFIDRAISGSDYDDYKGDDSESKNNQKIKATFFLEGPEDSGPEWKKALNYKRRTPLISEFPKRIRGPGVFGSVYPRYNKYIDKSSHVYNPNSNHGTNPSKISQSAVETEEQYLKENDQIYESNVDDFTEDHERAYVPKRLKEMVRSCIQKVYVERKRSFQKNVKWIIICEDQTTTIWLNCFGLEVKHLNQIQYMMDTDSRADSASLYVIPGTTPIDSAESTKAAATVHTFNSKKSNSRRRKERRAGGFKDDLKESFEDISELANTLSADLRISSTSAPKKQSIDTITYAPRGTGELWRPGS